MPLRVLVVSNFFPPKIIGGAEIVTYRQALALMARGHQVTVLAGSEQSESAPEGSLSFDRYEGLPVYRLALRSLDPSLGFHWPAAARRLKSIIAANQIEVVLTHNLMGLGANLIPAAKAAGARCLATLHDHWGLCFRNTRLRPDGSLCSNHDECSQCLPCVHPPGGVSIPTRLRRDYVLWCLSQADHIIIPSRYLAAAYEEAGFPAKQLEVLSNRIDLAAISDDPKEPSPDGVVRFLCSAYLGEHKGIPILLEALSQLAEDSSLASRWHMTIAGDGHLRPKVEAALKAGLERNVRLVGRLPRPQLLALLRRTDVSVLPSVWPENEPVSILEATASGTAQIATRIGGNIELVEDKRTGFLVTPGDPAALAAAMRAYISTPGLARRHGECNRERRQRLDEKHTIDRLEEILAASGKTPQHPATREPVIVCGSGWPPQPVADLVNHVHEHLLPGPIARFVWHRWADNSLWKHVALLWLWDRHPEEGLVLSALGRGAPVLAPRCNWTEGLARHYDSVILYDTYLEALAAIRGLLSLPSLRNEFARRSRAASGAAIALAPGGAFHLPSEAAS